MLFLCQEDELQLDNKIQFLFFYSSWMPLYKKYIITINNMEILYKNIRFLAIDANYFKSLCKRFDVKSTPTSILIRDGIEINRVIGRFQSDFFVDIL